jgi:hypothetical protein
MKSLLKLIGSFVLVALISCGRLTTEPSSTLAMVEIHKEQRTGVHSKREEIISSQAKWDAVWQEIVSDRSPKPPEPGVDFSRRVLIFVARGETGDACRQIAIDRIELRHASFEVFVNDIRPPMSCICPPITVQPVDIVAVPRVAQSATFQYSSITVGAECK